MPTAIGQQRFQAVKWNDTAQTHGQRNGHPVSKSEVMNKIGRNDPCPCGSGKKYQRCCEKKEAEMSRQALPSGCFRHEPGSYGSPRLGYMPSIICYKETGAESWTEHFCLVKPDLTLADEDQATAVAEEHLATASRAQAEAGGDPREFALSLRHEGYKSVSDFRIVGRTP